MKITGISAQAQNPDRVNISVDGKYRLSLAISQVVDLGVKVGKEYSEAELKALEGESQFGKLYVRAIEYCLLRPHSLREVRDYLHEKTKNKIYKSRSGAVKERAGVSQETVERIFNQLVERNYVSDETFARWWVETRHQRKGTSLRRLESELRAKGVDATTIAKAMTNSPRDEDSELRKVIAKKQHRYDDPQKFKQYLVRQGFSYDAVQSALENQTESD